MILEDVLCDLKGLVMDTGLFNQFYEYTEMIERDGRTFPAYYTGGGQYTPVYNLDVNGSGYIRKRGSVSIGLNSNYSKITACIDKNALLDITYPLRAVMAVPKIKLHDNAYSDDTLFSELSVVFGSSFSALPASEVFVSILGYDTDSLSIFAQEAKNVDHQIHFTLSYIAIDFNLNFTIARDCMPQACGYGY